MFYSPLRYPGGKSKIAPLIRFLLQEQGLIGGTYIEPFAGGAGVALDLLLTGSVERIVINDYDKGVYSFWRAILTETNRFVDLVRSIPLTIEEWHNQKEIVQQKSDKYSFELGFATFYLNRTNRSGIIKGGIIGGIHQTGEWKMDARFNRENLVERIVRIAERRDSIKVYNKDICSFLERYVPKYENNAFIYFDPPYYDKGKQLYLNYFSYDDHLRIEETIRNKVNCSWIITYDNVPEIVRLYDGCVMRQFDLNYSAAHVCKASEIIIFGPNIAAPSKRQLNNSHVYVDIRKL